MTLSGFFFQILVENSDKIEMLLKCPDLKLFITNFNRQIIINNHVMTD